MNTNRRSIPPPPENGTEMLHDSHVLHPQFFSLEGSNPEREQSPEAKNRVEYGKWQAATTRAG